MLFIAGFIVFRRWIIMLNIKGIQKLSVIDYEPYSSAVIFLPGCNFRCPYCHNSDLVLRPESLGSIAEDEILDFLEKRRQWLDAVVVTGGEPTLHDIEPFFSKLKKLGYKLKLDTNGTNPELLKRLLNKQLVDYIAMDIKAPFEKYQQITMLLPDIGKIKESVQIIMSSSIDYEFRITVLPSLVSKEDIARIAEQLKGAKRFVIQQFRPKGILDKSFENEKPYTKEELAELAEIAKKNIKKVEIRA